MIPSSTTSLAVSPTSPCRESQSCNGHSETADPFTSSQSRKDPDSIFTRVKRILAGAITCCAHLVHQIFSHLFQFPHRNARGESSELNSQLFNRTVQMLQVQDQDGDRPSGSSFVERSPFQLLKICSQIAVTYLRSKADVGGVFQNQRQTHSQLTLAQELTQPSISALSLFLDPSLVSLMPSRQSHCYSPNWKLLYTWHAGQAEMQLREQLAEWVSYFAIRSAVSDQDVANLFEVFCKLTLRKDVEIEICDRDQFTSIVNRLKNRFNGFHRDLCNRQHDFKKNLLKVTQSYSDKVNPVLDELLITALKSSCSPLLKSIWAGNCPALGEDQKRISIKSSLVKELGLNSPAQMQTLLKLVFFDHLCISSTAFNDPSLDSCHRLAMHSAFLWHGRCLHHLFERIWNRVSDLQSLVQVRSGDAIGQTLFAQLSMRDVHCMAQLLISHYLHRMARSELSGRILGIGKYNALVMWQAERLIVDPLMQGHSQSAWAMWVLHHLWPLFCCAVCCLPIDLTRQPRRALALVISKALTPLLREMAYLYQKVDGCIVSCFDASPEPLGGPHEELNRRIKAETASLFSGSRGFYLRSNGQIANCFDVDQTICSG